MPGKSGIQLVEEITRILPKVKIILMSGLADRMAETETLLEISCFLQKPFSKDKLLASVRNALKVA
jgi:DNA-binding NtrC family response regulator